MNDASFRQGESTDIEQVQAALNDAFTELRDLKSLEAQFYSVKPCQNKSPAKSVYYILKIALWFNLITPETELQDFEDQSSSSFVKTWGWDLMFHYGESERPLRKPAATCSLTFGLSDVRLEIRQLEFSFICFSAQ
ncbi:hypothetical protein NPIL_250911 [Nephila pilipes]|uniref:Uncharacterized protein n=1 Tax=Nephila pilipes TaxID=299642 RepID=A0A8X6PH30_NEPPI|nr:hypothetical protein NPIL_250911 [Nephila pilipes]